MIEVKVGDRVRIKDRPDWPNPPGYRLKNSEGTVVEWFEWDEPMAEFQDCIHVKLDKCLIMEYIGNTMPFEALYLEKI